MPEYFGQNDLLGEYFLSLKYAAIPNRQSGEISNFA